MEFNNIDLSNIKKFSLSGLSFIGKVIHIYDGDTITAVFKYKDEFNKWNCRLNGIDTPEIRSENYKEKLAGINARDFLRDNILDRIVQLDCRDFDKYGRLLVNIVYDNKNINQLMIDSGHAKLYDGGKKEAFDDK